MAQDKFSEYRLFGRRKGASLSRRQQHLFDELLPQVCVPQSSAPEKPLELKSVFSKAYARIHLEIGFGSAEHLIWQARRAPEVGFIGCEPFINGVVKLLTAIDELGLENIRIYNHDARVLLDLLPSSCLEKVYVLFPDPWPKLRHAKRRIITQKSLNQLARVMVSGAHLYIASDIPDYIIWIKQHIADNEYFEIADTGETEKPQTRYEQKAAEAGRNSVYLTFACTK